MLQWGRNLTVAEGDHCYMVADEGAYASMGPQLDSCGRADPFWKYARRKLGLQWGRNLTVAEGGGRGQGAVPRASFNGAAT